MTEGNTWFNMANPRPDQILKALPYAHPFLLVDEITEVDDDHIIGFYRLREDEYFYKGHFPGNPVTPGVILTEIAAQIGLVSFGIYFEMTKENQTVKNVVPLFSSADVDFFKPVYPGEKVMVTAKKEYFRFNKLKCAVEMTNEGGDVVLKGSISGMIAGKNE